LVSWLDLLLPRQTPNLRGGSMIDVADARVEAANTTESRGQSNFTHEQAGLIDELLGEMESAGLSYRYRGRSEMPEKQPAKMP
jgi:hypothetical protein